MNDRLPNLLIIGAQKCGSSTLAAELSSCSKISLGEEKEPGDLARYSTRRSNNALKIYSRKYASASPAAKYLLDASTIYSMRQRHPDCAEAALQCLGDKTRIIYITRDPVRRAISHHKHYWSRGLMDVNFDAALIENAELVLNGLYYYQLEPWLSRFDRKNILLVSLEELQDNRLSVLHKVATFLELLPGTFNFDSVQKHENVFSSSQINHSSAIGKFLTSRLYRDYIRPFTSNYVKSGARRIFSRDAGVSPIDPSPETIEMLKRLFELDSLRFQEIVASSTLTLRAR